MTLGHGIRQIISQIAKLPSIKFQKVRIYIGFELFVLNQFSKRKL